MSKLKGRHRKTIAQNETPPQNNNKPINRNNNNHQHQKSNSNNNKSLLTLLKFTKATNNTNRIRIRTRHHHHQPINNMGYLDKMTRVSLKLILWTLLLSVVQVGGQHLNNIIQQYTRSSSSSSSQNLVNNMPNQPAASFYSNVVAPESLPLSRQPSYGQPSSSVADLDNVIESTTMNSLHHHHQPFVPSLVSRSSNANQPPTTACQLPQTWTGKWYQANKEPIRVTNTEISDKGICRDKKGDKYLFEYTKQAHQTCLICLVINQRHLNVLQYKESSCQPVPAQYLNRTTNSQLILDNDHSLLDSICSDITGDAQLESLFRLETPSIECPISGKYHFTYDNCREPKSSLDSCIDKKQLHFKFSACPDVTGSESKSEVLKCYADWSEGNNYYMIGRLEHASNHQDKGKFRCFVYEKSADGGFIQMAQSLEESCYGLINAHEGPKTLRLTARPPTSNKCHFPSYIRSQSENWLSVDNSLIYKFSPNSTKFEVVETKEGSVIEEATCLQQFPPPALVHPHSMQSQSQHHLGRSNIDQQITPPTNRRYPPSSNQFNQIDQSYQQHQAAAASIQSSSSSSRLNDAVYLVQITKNCYTTDYCVRFYRRTSGIIQIDYFMAVPGSDDQQRCRNAYTNTTPQTQIITSTNLEEQKCPFEGAYTIEAPPESDFTYNPSNIFMCPRQSYLTAQCEHSTRLKIHYKCSLAKFMIKNLKCLGSWTVEKDGLVRLLLADDERQRYSAWYKDYSATTSMDVATTTQQLHGISSPSVAQHKRQLANTLATVIDLQIALITPVQTVSKPMQVKLTRKGHCSDLRTYPNPGSLPSIPPHASPSATSSAHPSSISMLYATGGGCNCSLALMIVSLFISLSFTRAFLAVERPR